MQLFVLDVLACALDYFWNEVCNCLCLLCWRFDWATLLGRSVRSFERRMAL